MNELYPGVNFDAMGKATWIYDNDPELPLGHVPCCSVVLRTGPFTGRQCGNGPLTGDAVMSGDCGQHNDSPS